MSYVSTMPFSPAFPGFATRQSRARRQFGMGDTFTDYNIGKSVQSKNVQIGGSVVAATATALAGSLAAAGGVVGISAAALTAAVPFIGPALMGATLLVQYLVANSGCGQTCIVTSQWANQAADALQQVMDGYFALPAPRTVTQKALAVANFQTIWKQLQQACGQPGTGDAGKRCISDRQSGACTWRQKFAPVYPGQPAIGECWNWWNGFLKPIQDDPVVPDPTVSSELQSVFGGSSSVGGSSSLMPLLLIGGLVALGVAL